MTIGYHLQCWFSLNVYDWMILWIEIVHFAGSRLHVDEVKISVGEWRETSI